MKTMNRRLNLNQWAFILLCILLMPIHHFGQAECPGTAPPDDNLYLISNDVLQTFDYSAYGVISIHSYEKAGLVFLTDLSDIPPDILRGITAIQNPATIHFRDWTREFVTPNSVDLSGFKDGYQILAMFGPMEPGLVENLRASGLIVMGPLPPYGLLVKADAPSMQRALGLCTSYGYRTVREIFPIPEETRLSSALRGMASGMPFNLDNSGIVHTPDGGIVVRVLPYPDGCEAETMGRVASMLQAAGQEYSHGYMDAFVIQADQISPLLGDVRGIAFIAPLTLDGPSSNIAMRGDILNIAPVWDELNYTGENRDSPYFSPSKQSSLIANWERVKELEDTNADPQAVLSNIDNFQKNVDKWVTAETVRNNVNQAVDLYRAAYLQEHSPPGNP